MRNVLGNARYWGGGIAAAAIGIVLARLVAPHVASHRAALTIAGEMIALGGLLLICVGVSRRVAADRQSLPR